MYIRRYLSEINYLLELLLKLDENQLQGVIDLVRSYIG